MITVCGIIGPGYKKAETEGAIWRTRHALPHPNEPLLIEEPSITDLASYSRFVLFELHKRIKTPHVLLVQWDGYATHANRWTDDFLRYDYIGAPWPSHMAPAQLRVGNGGFSLRSYRWLMLGLTIEDQWKGEAEDVFCCRTRRQHWQHLCRIAPLSIAMRFSVEHPIREFPNWKESDSFGFHGFFKPDREKYRLC